MPYLTESIKAMNRVGCRRHGAQPDDTARMLGKEGVRCVSFGKYYKFRSCMLADMAKFSVLAPRKLAA